VSSAKLKVGQVLQLPVGAEASEPRVRPAQTTARQRNSERHSSSRYVVKVGDTLNRIARAHRTTVKAIKMANV